MTNPCEIGLRCPFMRYDEDGDSICVYPYGVVVPENETFALIECVDCRICDLDSDLSDLIHAYQMDEATRKAVEEYKERSMEEGRILTAEMMKRRESE